MLTYLWSIIVSFISTIVSLISFPRSGESTGDHTGTVSYLSVKMSSSSGFSIFF